LALCLRSFNVFYRARPGRAGGRWWWERPCLYDGEASTDCLVLLLLIVGGAAWFYFLHDLRDNTKGGLATLLLPAVLGLELTGINSYLAPSSMLSSPDNRMTGFSRSDGFAANSSKAHLNTRLSLFERAVCRFELWIFSDGCGISLEFHKTPCCGERFKLPRKHLASSNTENFPFFPFRNTAQPPVSAVSLFFESFSVLHRAGPFESLVIEDGGNSTRLLYHLFEAVSNRSFLSPFSDSHSPTDWCLSSGLISGPTQPPLQKRTVRRTALGSGLSSHHPLARSTAQPTLFSIGSCDKFDPDKRNIDVGRTAASPKTDCTASAFT